MSGLPSIELESLLEPVKTWNPKTAKDVDKFVYVDLGAIDQKCKKIVGQKEISCREAPSRARQVVKAGDVLVATVRPNLNAVAIVPEELSGATVSTGFCVLRPIPGVLDSQYLFHWVKTKLFVQSMVRQASGASYPAISDRIVLNSKIPYLEFMGQREVASVLDCADLLREKLQNSVAELDALISSTFVELFGWGQQAPVTIGDSLEAHPNGWKWELLTDVARLATGHTPDRQNEEYWGGDIPWLSLTDIRRLDLTVARETSERVTQLGIDNSSSVKLPVGTVCFSRTASIGFITVMGCEMATSQDFFNWVCGSNLEPLYLMYALFMSRSRLRLLSTGSTHKTIYFPTAEIFRVLVPPVELQKKFAQQVISIKELRELQMRRLSELDILYSSLQHRAFRGEL
ncbi:restriction endonuclease subunit S [Pseudomonas fluorescens]|uniref:Restriction endonuclease subunit S n=1 Tax=Pseudomonas fluorescens TaxID=294 RepID=A0AAP8Z5K2_PSEFL|nr:restriction endonuclease subunit S [Pseudomonas fluorescens]QBX43608.1 restriction endonuclease subunit S [Pseudomonas fluorescens]